MASLSVGSRLEQIVVEAVDLRRSRSAKTVVWDELVGGQWVSHGRFPRFVETHVEPGVAILGLYSDGRGSKPAGKFRICDGSVCFTADAGGEPSWQRGDRPEQLGSPHRFRLYPVGRQQDGRPRWLWNLLQHQADQNDTELAFNPTGLFFSQSINNPANTPSDRLSTGVFPTPSYPTVQDPAGRTSAALFNNRTPYIEEWNMNVERALFKDVALQLAYVAKVQVVGTTFKVDIGAYEGLVFEWQ